jgi:hypothetical protein
VLGGDGGLEIGRTGLMMAAGPPQFGESFINL